MTRGIGKRLSNRNTINAFISSLETHYGEEVKSRMDFRPLRNLQDRGKPLHVRDINAVISEADMVADGINSVRSSISKRWLARILPGLPIRHFRAVKTWPVRYAVRSMSPECRSGLAGNSILMPAWERCPERPGLIPQETGPHRG